MPLRVENLHHLGWEPYTVQTYQSWCGHTQEIIRFLRAETEMRSPQPALTAGGRP
jgi:hypothetical protein